MVKNVKGGNKAKSVARFNAPTFFRPAKEEGELYAVIEKNMGNGVLNVKCIDNVERLCMVRKKFTKERSLIKPGAWILVGLREFESRKDKCDLIEIYSQSDIARLQTLDAPWHVLGVEKEDIVFEETIDIPETAPIALDMEDIDVDEI